MKPGQNQALMFHRVSICTINTLSGVEDDGQAPAAGQSFIRVLRPHFSDAPGCDFDLWEWCQERSHGRFLSQVLICKVETIGIALHHHRVLNSKCDQVAALA
jgi:hypothetical protein